MGTDANYLDDQPGAMKTPFRACKFETAECCWYEQDFVGNECNQGEVPLYAVDAISVEHVSTAIRWAQDHNISVNIKSTGHDYQGRSTSSDTL